MRSGKTCVDTFRWPVGIRKGAVIDVQNRRGTSRTTEDLTRPIDDGDGVERHLAA
jgi:hypothetical protein